MVGTCSTSLNIPIGTSSVVDDFRQKIRIAVELLNPQTIVELAPSPLSIIDIVSTSKANKYLVVDKKNESLTEHIRSERERLFKKDEELTILTMDHIEAVDFFKLNNKVLYHNGAMIRCSNSDCPQCSKKQNNPAEIDQVIDAVRNVEDNKARIALPLITDRDIKALIKGQDFEVIFSELVLANNGEKVFLSLILSK